MASRAPTPRTFLLKFSNTTDVSIVRPDCQARKELVPIFLVQFSLNFSLPEELEVEECEEHEANRAFQINLNACRR
jgi:hypothetical protein